MKPFTKEEMIRVARSADAYGDYQHQILSGVLAVLTSSGGITVSHSIKTGRFSLSNNDKAFVHSYDILAVADTIRDILKEREA